MSTMSLPHEHDAFLANHDPESGNSKKTSDSNGKCCCLRLSHCKYIALIVGIIILVAGIFLLVGYFVLRSKMTGSVSSEDSQEWNDKLSDAGWGEDVILPEHLSGK